jgi:hypothetical protein
MHDMREMGMNVSADTDISCVPEHQDRGLETSTWYKCVAGRTFWLCCAVLVE